jgi:hypothetical protein
MLKIAQKTKEGENFANYLLGEINGVRVITLLHKHDIKEDVNLQFLPEDTLNEIIELGEEARKPNLSMFIDPAPPVFELTHNQYYDLLALKDSILFNRSISTIDYFRYLLQSLTIKQLKTIHRDFELSKYSKLNKDELINNLNLSISEEEKLKWLLQHERRIIQGEFNRAINIINGHAQESLKEIRIINTDTHEIECEFKANSWTTTNFLMINKDTITDPDRDCDCRTGSEMGFCPHFWVAFIKSVQLGFFEVKEWHLTTLPQKIRHYIKTIKI